MVDTEADNTSNATSAYEANPTPTNKVQEVKWFTGGNEEKRYSMRENNAQEVRWFGSSNENGRYSMRDNNAGWISTGEPVQSTDQNSNINRVFTQAATDYQVAMQQAQKRIEDAKTLYQQQLNTVKANMNSWSYSCTPYGTCCMSVMIYLRGTTIYNNIVSNTGATSVFLDGIGNVVIQNGQVWTR